MTVIFKEIIQINDLIKITSNYIMDLGFICIIIVVIIFIFAFFIIH